MVTLVSGLRPPRVGAQLDLAADLTSSAGLDSNVRAQSTHYDLQQAAQSQCQNKHCFARSCCGSSSNQPAESALWSCVAPAAPVLQYLGYNRCTARGKNVREKV